MPQQVPSPGPGGRPQRYGLADQLGANPLGVFQPRPLMGTGQMQEVPLNGGTSPWTAAFGG